MYYTLGKNINMEFLYINSTDDTGMGISVVEVGHSRPQKGKNVHIKANSYHLHYVINGEGSFQFNSIKGGQGFLILPGEVYNEIVLSDDFEQYWINFKGINVINLLRTVGMPHESHIFSYCRNPLEYSLVKSSFIEIFNTDISLSGTIMYMLSLLYRLLTINESNNKEPCNITNRYVQSVCSYIDEHYMDDLNIAMLSKIVGVSQQYLSNIFHAITKQTLVSYITDKRINMAKLLLTHTDLTIAEIANEVGFKDPFYFSRVFHNYCNICPSKWKGNVNQM